MMSQARASRHVDVDWSLLLDLNPPPGYRSAHRHSVAESNVCAISKYDHGQCVCAVDTCVSTRSYKGNCEKRTRCSDRNQNVIGNHSIHVGNDRHVSSRSSTGQNEDKVVAILQNILLNLEKEIEEDRRKLKVFFVVFLTLKHDD